jgi:hypothetical protein
MFKIEEHILPNAREGDGITNLKKKNNLPSENSFRK